MTRERLRFCRLARDDAPSPAAADVLGLESVALLTRWGPMLEGFCSSAASGSIVERNGEASVAERVREGATADALNTADWEGVDEAEGGERGDSRSARPAGRAGGWGTGSWGFAG